MKKGEIRAGGEYAIKWDLSRKGELPLGVFRGLVLATDHTYTVKRWDTYAGHYPVTLTGYKVEVKEILFDPRWGHKKHQVARFGRSVGRVVIEVGSIVEVENGQPFVAPWDAYMADRGALDQAKAEEESEQWETEQRSGQIAERLAALGFTVREHGLPHRKGFVPHADYTIADRRLTLEALDRLVAMVETQR